MDWNDNQYEMYDPNYQRVVFHPYIWWFFFSPHMMPPAYPPRPPRPPGPPHPPGPPPGPQPREYM